MNYVFTPPPYPVDAFHVVIKNAVQEVQQQIQAPDALVAMEFLTCMSVLAQGLYDVRLPTGQLRPVAVYVATIADSGERKTAVGDAVSAPIHDFDQQSMVKYEIERVQYELDIRTWKAIDVGLCRQLTKLTQDREPTDDVRLRLTEHAKTKPVKPRLRSMLHQDTTPRATMDKLEGDGESMAYKSDEGEIIIKGGALNQVGLLNKVWDGVSMLALDRSDGVNVIARNPRLTVAYMVQSQIFQNLLDRKGDSMRGSGHWARYLIGWPASTQGTRYTYSLDRQWIHLPKFHEISYRLLEEFDRRSRAGAMTRDVLEFSEDAIAKWISLTNNTESMLQPCGYLSDIKDFASKAVEITGRVAALLHVFSGQEGKISVDTLERAIAIVGWHLEEFKRIFSPGAGIPQEHADALKLEDYLYDNYWCRGFTFAQKNLVLKNGPVRPSARLDAAIECMIAKGAAWITVGRKRERYITLNNQYFPAPKFMVGM